MTHVLQGAQGNAPLDILDVNPAQPEVESWAYGVIWRGVNEIRIALGDAHWYGQGGLGHQQWPLEKIAQYPAPFVTSDNGGTGLLGILEPLWINSNGFGVWVEGDRMETSFNAPLKGEPPAQSFGAPAPLDQRPPLAAGRETDGTLTIRGEGLTIRFFVLDSARAVVEAFWQQIEVSDPPPDYLFERPLWTTWARFKNNIAHHLILDHVQSMQQLGFQCSIFGIDAKWQRAFGDTRFDPAPFPNPRHTIRMLHELGMAVTLWCVPFFNADSMHFQTAIDEGYVIKREDGTPYIGQWWEGEAVFLDVTNPDALEWHMGRLERLAGQVGVDGFKFDAGEGMFYDIPGTVRHDGGAPNTASTTYIRGAAAHYPWSDSRAAWRSQAFPMLFRQWDKSSVWGYDNGLASCITQAMTLNLLGYPYSFPDMIGGNQYFDQKVTAELMIRWTQAVAPMPIIQFSLAPWDYGGECAEICAQYADLHRQVAAQTIKLARQRVPLVRPLWWLAPHDEDALTCADEYLIGDDLLVAPVIVEGARSRDIYLPPGTWQSGWDPSEVHEGGQWLRDYPAPLNVLPLFERAESSE
jgi:alpha-glucosidase (family GH31 glycosyl hydrolase)